MTTHGPTLYDPRFGAPVWDTGSNLNQVLAYDGSGNLTSITSTDGTSTWVKTFTWTASQLTGISTWVLQT